MPIKKKSTAATAQGALPQIPTELLDQLVTGAMTPGAIEDMMRGFKKALIERALGAEMTHHLGYSPGSVKPREASNHRNGTSGKIIAMYARGMTVREIQGFLAEMYAVDVSPDLISSVTDGLKGMGEALGVLYPARTLQTCIVHLIRNSAGRTGRF